MQSKDISWDENIFCSHCLFATSDSWPQVLFAFSLSAQDLTSFFRRIITNHCVTFCHLPLSLVLFFAPLELLKTFTCWSNHSRGVRAHNPTFLIFFYSCVLALLFPFTTYSLLLLCLMLCGGNSSVSSMLWGAWRTPFFSPKVFTFFTSESSEYTYL